MLNSFNIVQIQIPGVYLARRTPSEILTLTSEIRNQLPAQQLLDFGDGATAIDDAYSGIFLGELPVSGNYPAQQCAAFSLKTIMPFAYPRVNELVGYIEQQRDIRMNAPDRHRVDRTHLFHGQSTYQALIDQRRERKTVQRSPPTRLAMPEQ